MGLHQVKWLRDIRYAPLCVVAAMSLAGCSRTVSRSPAEAPRPPVPVAPGAAARELAPPAATAPGGGPGTGAPSTYYGAPETPPSGLSTAPSAELPASALPAPPASDARDRQLEILIDAVAALRQESQRSYDRSEDLRRENKRLRALAAALRRELAKSRDEKKALEENLRALENQLEEMSPPAAVDSGEALPREAPTGVSPGAPARQDSDATSGQGPQSPNMTPAAE